LSLIIGAAIALASIVAGYFLCFFTNKPKPEPAKENPYEKYKDSITGLYKRPSKVGE